MNILLVNDDSFYSDGIKALEKVLSSYGHKISIVAPEEQQSGKSHSMALLGTCYAKKHAEDKYSITGSPADCVIYGLKSGLIKNKPDVVISGINHGYNISTDIIYSGTCAAARQASMYGFKAIAISEGTYMINTETGKVEDFTKGFHFEETAEFLAKNLDLFLSKLDSNAFLNINVPHSFNGKWALSSIGETEYEDKFSFKEENGLTSITNTDVEIIFHKRESEYPNDFETVEKNMASVTYINLNPTISHVHMKKHNE